MRFGVLCNGKEFQRWQLDAIRLLVEAGHTSEILVVNANQTVAPTFIEKLIHYPYSKLLVRVWFRYFNKPVAKEMINFSELNIAVPERSCVTLKRGYSEYFNESDITFIKSLNLDFLLRFGFSILKGEILGSAKYGVWSYHHDDDRKYRGAPTGFWEILFGDPVNAAILQQLTDKIDSGVVLHKAFFATINHSWEANLDNLLQRSTEWPLQVCKRIENGDTGFLSVTNSPQSKIYKMPGNLLMLKFMLKLFANKARFHYRDLFIKEKWNIGIVSSDVKTLLNPGAHALPDPTWLNISSRRSLYHADSFGFVKDNLIHVICEEYDYKTAKGILVSLQFDRDSLQPVKKTTALEKNHHLAYPFLFEHKGKYYCIPENSEGGDVDLYIFDPGSGELNFEHTLIKGLQAVDPSLVFYNGYWWLFFTDRVSTNERLHIWYSADLKGEYLPHANNPVKTDVRSSRPAGTPFMVEGQLYRPAQDCSVRSGGRIAINRVLRLSPTAFEEEVISTISPSGHSKWKDGIHTICVCDGLMIVDGKTECFIWPAFTRKLTKKFKRIFRK